MRNQKESYLLVKPRVALGLPMLVVSLLAASCCNLSGWALSDVKPGAAESHSWTIVLGGAARLDRKVTITGHSYDEIWNAAILVAQEHFAIREQDRARGVIRAERTEISWGHPCTLDFYWSSGGGAWVGIFIVPAATVADLYVVEVVSLPMHVGDPILQNWTEKVPRDMQRVLDGQPIG